MHPHLAASYPTFTSSFLQTSLRLANSRTLQGQSISACPCSARHSLPFASTPTSHSYPARDWMKYSPLNTATGSLGAGSGFHFTRGAPPANGLILERPSLKQIFARVTPSHVLTINTTSLFTAPNDREPHYHCTPKLIYCRIPMDAAEHDLDAKLYKASAVLLEEIEYKLPLLLFCPHSQRRKPRHQILDSKCEELRLLVGKKCNVG